MYVLDKKIRYAPSKPQFFFIKVGFVEKKKKKKKKFVYPQPTYSPKWCRLKKIKLPFKKKGEKMFERENKF